MTYNQTEIELLVHQNKQFRLLVAKNLCALSMAYHAFIDGNFIDDDEIRVILKDAIRDNATMATDD